MTGLRADMEGEGEPGPFHRGACAPTRYPLRTPGFAPPSSPTGVGSRSRRWSSGARRRGPVFYLGAAFHGDEIAGTQIVGRVASGIDPAALRGTLIAVPVQNPLAFQVQHRFFVGHMLKSPMDQNPADPWAAFPGRRGREYRLDRGARDLRPDDAPRRLHDRRPHADHRRPLRAFRLPSADAVRRGGGRSGSAGARVRGRLHPRQ